MLKSLELVDLKIPFRHSFKHRSAERSETQTAIVIAGDGLLKGFGEGCPREYVTNESPGTVTTFFNKMKREIVQEVEEVGSLISFKLKHSSLIENNHAAWCAIELALLDLLGKRKGCSVEKLLQRPELNGLYKYTAVIGDGSLNHFADVARQHHEMGFCDYKIKITGDPESDYGKILFLKELDETCTVRLDANNIWDNTASVVDYLGGLPFSISGMEEPLLDRKLDSLIALSKKIETPIILDESFIHFKDLKKVLPHKESFIINLRVSKMGGILNSLRIADFCLEAGVPIIVGAQVGESSILTRAGLLIAGVLKPNYVGLEGAYGTHLLQYDVVEKPLMIGPGCLLDPQQFLSSGTNGLQLDILEDLEKLT